ncbi:unnamed protein product [Heterosigma akashiwo]
MSQGSRVFLILAAGAVLSALIVLSSNGGPSPIRMFRSSLTNFQVGYDFGLLQPTPTEYVRTAKDGYMMLSVNMWEDPRIQEFLMANRKYQEEIWSICVHPDQPNLDIYFKADKQAEGPLDEAITIFALDCRSIDPERYGVLGFVVAIDKAGNIVNVMSTDDKEVGRVEGISMYDTNTALLSAYHAAYLWNFRTGELTQLPFAADTHSLVYSWDDDNYYGMYSDAASRKDHTPQGAGSFNGRTGLSRLEDPTIPGWGPFFDKIHMNYLTIEGDYAYCSSRAKSALSKVDMRTNEKIWTLGGAGQENDFTIYDINGNPYPKDFKSGDEDAALKRPWNHQHKFQHLGMGFYSLFDNNVGDGHEQVPKPWGTSSRNVILYVDEASRQAWEVFSHPTGDNAMSYGGTDLLPSGNVLTTSYVDWVHPADPDHQYHVNIWEVSTATNEVEWRAGFKGFNPVAPENLRDPYPHYFFDPLNPDGHVPTLWNIYTADRAYSTVFALHLCSARGGAAVRFSPFNTVRTQNDAPGVAYLLDPQGQVAAQKPFMYQKAWLDRPEEIEVPLGLARFQLGLNNQWDNPWAQDVDMHTLQACA